MYGRIRYVLTIFLAWWVIGLFVINFLVAFETTAVRTFTPTYLFTRLSRSTSGANLIYFVMYLGAGIAAIIAGNLADRINRLTAGATIFTISAVMLLATVIVPANSKLPVGWFFLIGFVLYAISPIKNALTSSYSERAFSGSLFGLMLSASSIGSALRPLVLGVTVERLSWTIAFPAIGVTSLLGGIAFLLLAKY